MISERNLRGFISKVVPVLAVGISLYHIYIAYYGYGEPLIHRGIHVTTLIALGFLNTGLRKKTPGRLGLLVNVVFALVALSVGLFICLDFERIITRWTIDPLTPYDWFFGLSLMALLITLTHRLMGLPLVLVAALSLLYPFIGPYLPANFAHSGMGVSKLLSELFLTMNGIFSAPTAASANFIFIFVLLGAFLLKSGAAEFFIDFAKAVAGGTVGGPAKIAVIASSFFGSISGSPTANVVTTGSFTIPLMKKTGFRPSFAAAVESVASMGGAVMPPVMHAAAFLMVEITGIPYLSIIKAAIFPGLLFYLGLFLMVHLQAVSKDLQAIPKDELPLVLPVVRRGSHFLLPLILIVVLLVMGYTIARAGLVAMIGTVVVSWFRADTRMGIRKIVDALISGAKSAIVIMASCATAGIVVGVIGATGLGGKFTSLVVSLGEGSLLLSLVFTMISCIILGMGMPTPVAYILTAILAGPALSALGIPVLSAHLFILYFASISTITPPVAVAAYAAAGIAEANPLKTGLTAVRLAGIAFIVPFMFIFQPALLLSGSFVKILLSIITAIFGVSAFAIGVEGWLFIRVGYLYRLLFILAGLMLLYPQMSSDLAGFMVLLLLLFMTWRQAGMPKLSATLSLFLRGKDSV